MAFELAGLTELFSTYYRLLLFPSKKIAKRFATYQEKSKEVPIVGNNGGSIKESRYTILTEIDGEAYVLLYTERTKESSLPLLLRLFNELFINMKITPLTDFKYYEEFYDSFLEAIYRYNRKFGAKFVYPSEFLDNLSMDIFVKSRMSYIENRALNELSKNTNLNEELLDYISLKIKFFFNRTDKLKINSFLQLLNLIGVYEVSTNFLAALQPNTNLYTFANTKLERVHKEIRKELGTHQDVSIALEDFKKKMVMPQRYVDFETYIKTFSRSMIDFFDALEPNYMWLEGSEPLAIAYKGYIERISVGTPAKHPQIGSIDDFILLLEDVFKRIDLAPKVYPEPSLECGHLLLVTLTNLVRYTKSEYYFKKALEEGTRLSEGIERNVDYIKRKNPGSIFDHLQAAVSLMELSTMCTNFKRWDKTVELLDKAKELAYKNNLIEIKLRSHWIKFLLTHDYEEALQVYKLHLNKGNIEFKFPKIMALILSGIFEERQRIEHFQEAVNLSLEGKVEEHALVTALLDDLFAQKINYYVSNIFLYVAKAEESDQSDGILQELLKAKPFAVALEADSNMQMASENLFSWKTMILIELLKKNQVSVKDYLRKLKAFPVKSRTNDIFSKKVEAILLNERVENWNLKIQAFQINVETHDIWSRILDKVIQLNFKEFLDERSGLNPKAILFVEGPTEEEILPIISNKIGISLSNMGIEVISLRGASKAKLAVKFWKQMTERISVPLFMILDKDAEKYGSNAVQAGLLKIDNLFILSRGTIEEYYPLGVLTKSIEELCGQLPSTADLIIEDRVSSVNSFLKKNKYYDDWKISLGRKVVERMNPDDLNEELKLILTKISQLMAQ